MKIKGYYLIWVLVFCCQAKIETTSTPVEARVMDVKTSGSPGSYNFRVTLTSPDEGCQQYADWWEVVDISGKLRYRRILGHSHVNEQPFTRSGSPVDVSSETEVWVRVHMNNTGYSNLAMYGSAQSGFESREFPEDFAKDLDQQAPLPDGCRF